MTTEEVKIIARENWKILFYENDKKGGIICPLCGSGSGKNGSGISADTKHQRPHYLRCWSCGFNGDIIDLYMQDKRLEYAQAINDIADYMGITIDGKEEIKKAAPVANEKKENHKEAMKTTDYSEYYKQCKENLSGNKRAISYLEGRGISIETAGLFNIGFDSAWISPQVRKNQEAKGSSWKPPATQRIILPISKNYYVARDINPSNKQYGKMNETGGGEISIFNLEALWSERENIFITEGVFDALSIIEIGQQAIALNSTSLADLLLKAIENRPTKATLILCLDKDEAGQNATRKLEEGLQRFNINYVTADICGNKKDPNEALTENKAEFVRAVEKAIELTAAKPHNISSYIDLYMKREIEELNQEANKQTGFSNLDEKAGGLNAGLYVIAAISSLGKTTFAHQMADNLASSGHDVLFFSLEQSRLELVSKSLARITAKKNMQTASTSLAIRKGIITENVKEAAEEYKKAVGDRMNIIEGNFGCNISFIGEYVRNYIKRNKCKPIVFIDYLQILQPQQTGNRQQTTKEMVDTTITELKRLSRENQLTVFIISSVNRANYLTPIDFESLKESGGIEYTADVIWGLQLQCLNEDIFEKATDIKKKRDRVREAKAADPRKIELLCLKNRYGISSYSCGFDYFPKYDLFAPGAPSGFLPCYDGSSFEAEAPIKEKRKRI